MAGLSRTGTTSIHTACEQLGLTSVHFDLSKVQWITRPETANFRAYDDVDVVCDLPTASFFLELSQAYPEANVLLSHRPEKLWWESVNRYFSGKPTYDDQGIFEILRAFCSRSGRRTMKQLKGRSVIRKFAYGSVVPDETLWRAAYREHNARVRSTVDPGRLYELDVSAGDGWPQLCAAIGLEHVPDRPFPHSNRTQ